MLLEGPDLKGVLREVEANYGRDFHVIQAEQVRSGGVGGFFTKQHYEVTVEINDPQVVAKITAQPQTAGMSLNELATRSQNDQAAASSQDWARDLLEKARTLDLPENSHDVDRAYGAGPDSFTTTEGVDFELSNWSNLTSRADKGRKFRLKLRRNKSPRGTAGVGPRRTDPASLDQQKRLKELLTKGPLIEEPPASVVYSAAEVASVFQDNVDKENDDSFSDLPPAARLVAQSEGTSSVIPGPQKEVGSKQVIAGVHVNASPKLEVAQKTSPTSAPAVDTSSTEPCSLAGARSGDIYGPESEAYWRVQIGDQIKAQRDKAENFYSRRGPIGTEEARRIQIFAAAETIARTSPAKTSAKSHHRAAQTVEAAQTNIGDAEPTAHAETFESADIVPKIAKTKPASSAIKFQAPDLAPVTHMNAAISQGIPTSAGEILVLIGDVHEAYQQACEIIEVADCGGIEVLAITPAGLAVPEIDAEDHFRHSWADQVFDLARRSDSPTIVIVHAPFPIGNNDLERVRIVKAIEALETPHVWAIVDASHAISSLSQWTRCFGHISGLAVVNAEETKNPQALTALGIPVVFVDGRPCLENSDAITRPNSSLAVEQIGSLQL
jgi:hypothetical protein